MKKFLVLFLLSSSLLAQVQIGKNVQIGGPGLTGPSGSPGPPGPTSSPSAYYRYISQLGCAAQNSNLNTGGGTDDTSCINTALSFATASHPVILIQDGVSLVHGIVGPTGGGWGIIGLGGGISSSGVTTGSGFYLANSSNTHVIGNGTVTCGVDPLTIPPARGSGIILKDLVINGNGANNGAYCYGFAIANVNNITVDNVVFYNVSHYSILFNNVGYSTVRASKFVPYAPGVHPVNVFTDGIHIDGPANDIAISDNYLHTGDDAIALNAPEGYCGPISRVTITNNTVDDSFSMFRADTNSVVCSNGSTPIVDAVTISNYSGTFYNNMGYFGNNIGTHALTVPNSITNVKWGNSVVKGPTGMFIYDSVGSLEFHDFIWTLTPGNSHLFWFGQNLVPVNDLSLNNITLASPASTTPASLFENLDGSTIGTVASLGINGFNVTPLGGSSMNLLVGCDSCDSTVTNLKIVGVNSAHISALYSASSVGNVYATNAQAILPIVVGSGNNYVCINSFSNICPDGATNNNSHIAGIGFTQDTIGGSFGRDGGVTIQGNTPFDTLTGGILQVAGSTAGIGRQNQVALLNGSTNNGVVVDGDASGHTPGNVCVGDCAFGNSVPTTFQIGGINPTVSIGGLNGFSGTKVAGSCTITFSAGIVTGVTGC
jgi:hypothetical protein